MKTTISFFAVASYGVLLIALSPSTKGEGGTGSGEAIPPPLRVQASVSTNSVRTPAALAAQPKIAVAYGDLPLSFEANRGQADPRVKFVSRGHGYGLFFTSTEVILSLDQRKTANASSPVSSSSTSRMRPVLAGQDSASRRRPGSLQMSLAGANSAARIAGLDELPGKANYFLGNDPTKWRTNVPTYARVKYDNVYPGVDLIYYGNQRDLESDFVVAPRADTRVIRLTFIGTERIEINRDGDLVLKLRNGETILRKPVAYQRSSNNEFSANDSGKHFVTARYVLENRREVSFAVGAYDTSDPLIIDPVLAYSTYLGGSGIDVGNAIAVDASGNAYVAGHTSSTDFPTATPIQPSYHPSGQNCVNNRFPGGIAYPCPDAFVTKLNAAGTAVLYSTYLGGSSYDAANGITVDSSGNAYVAGQTYSPDFPTMNPAQASIGPANCSNPHTGAVPCADAFVAKLNPTGDALVFSTYLGGSGSDGANAIAVDSFGSAYVTGFTSSSDFPTTPGAYDTTCGTDGACNPDTSGINHWDAFVTKFDPSGSKLLYSTYLGGSSDDSASGIALDSSGNAYVTGGTYSSDFPTTTGAFDTVGHSQGDAFVAKLDQSGAKLLYSTYLGGGGWDSSAGIAVDAFGNAYVTGFTFSTDFPTQNPFQATSAGISNGGSAAFITKLNPSGTALVYSTYLGGSVSDVATGLALDSSGRAYVTGATASGDFPINSPVQAGSANGFVTTFDPTGSKLVYSTYLGSRQGWGSAIAVDAAGNAFVTGRTDANFPVTLGSLKTVSSGGWCLAEIGSSVFQICTDAFLVKISPADLPGFVVLPVSLNFGIQAVSTSVAQTLSLLDAGSQPLTITSIAFNGANAGDFSDTTTCPVSSSTLAGGTNCTISVTFSPQTLGTKTAMLVVTDDAAGSPHSIPLTGVSATPATAVLSPTSLTFGSEPIGSSSSPQAITLTNTGGVPLSISGISFVPDFSVVSGPSACPSTVSGGTSCTINVVFAPQTSGPLNESLTLTDNAADSPQTVALAGTGQDFTFSSGSTSATITAGQTATFTLSVTPESGFSQTTNLSCSVSPVVSLGPACSVAPPSVTPNGSTATTATVTVTTAARTSSSAAIIKRTIFPESRLWAALFCLPALACMFIGAPRRRWFGSRQHVWVGIGFVLLVALLSFGCGGGSSSSRAQSGTPAGTYTMTVTGTSGSLTHTINLTLKVK